MAAADRYQADVAAQAQLGSASTYAGAQRYGSDQQLAGTQAMAAADRYQADMAAGAQRYQAELGLRGQLGSASTYAGAQRFAAQLGLQGTQAQAAADRYRADQDLTGQRYAAFGRAQAPRAQWTRGW
jgi:hypothetical protein